MEKDIKKFSEELIIMLDKAMNQEPGALVPAIVFTKAFMEETVEELLSLRVNTPIARLKREECPSCGGKLEVLRQSLYMDEEFYIECASCTTSIGDRLRSKPNIKTECKDMLQQILSPTDYKAWLESEEKKGS